MEAEPDIMNAYPITKTVAPALSIMRKCRFVHGYRKGVPD